MVSLMKFRRVLIRPKWSSSSFLLSIIILILAFNFAVILFYTAIAPLLRSREAPRQTGQSVEVALWDTNQDAEPDCGEGKGKLLNTDWMLRLIQTASKMLRNYRRKNLARMEQGVKGTAMSEDDVFSLMEPLLTMISDPKKKSPDFMKMLPQLVALWFKVQRSGMFSATDDNVADSAAGLHGWAANQGPQPNAPSGLDLEMLNNLLALLPKT